MAIRIQSSGPNPGRPASLQRCRRLGQRAFRLRCGVDRAGRGCDTAGAMMMFAVFDLA
jgi:hypothetical protein